MMVMGRHGAHGQVSLQYGECRTCHKAARELDNRDLATALTAKLDARAREAVVAEAGRRLRWPDAYEAHRPSNQTATG